MQVERILAMKSLGIYVHIPFCIKKCNYCDFQSVGNSKEVEHMHYFQGLQSEMLLWKELYGNKFHVDSIFIGGGTPSFVNETYILNMVESLKKNFKVDSEAEITIECNPKTLNEEKLNAYKHVGINRLSIGAQSMEDQILAYMGRSHSSQDFLETFQLARDNGFKNINVDLIFGMPGTTLDSWENTLKKIIELDPEHISFYSLQLEKGTPFFEAFEAGYFQEISDELNRKMYWLAVDILKEKYIHYEISNAAKAGFFCEHNLKYWSMKDYLGIGLGAHSFVNGYRFNNLALQSHENTKEENMQEFIFTGLRKVKGISLTNFEEAFGEPLLSKYGKEIEKLQNENLIDLYSNQDNEKMMRFTPLGIDVSNKVLAVFV